MCHCENKTGTLDESIANDDLKKANGDVPDLDETDTGMSSVGPCHSQRHGPWGGCISVSGTPESFACLKTAGNRSDVLEATKQSSREPTMLQPWGGICPQMRVSQRARSAKGALLVRMLHLTALSAVLVPLAVRQVLRAKSARCVQPENSTQRTVGDTSTVRTALSARSARQANSATLLGSRSLRGTVCLGMS